MNENNTTESSKNQNTEASTNSQKFPTPDFNGFISGLYTQTLLAMGAVEAKNSNQHEVDLNECQFLIDTVAMLEKKTVGNLTEEESKHIKSILSDLRMRYVTVARENS